MARLRYFFLIILLINSCNAPIIYRIDNPEHGDASHICNQECDDKKWDGYRHGHPKHYCERRCIWFVR